MYTRIYYTKDLLGRYLKPTSGPIDPTRYQLVEQVGLNTTGLDGTKAILGHIFRSYNRVGPAVPDERDSPEDLARLDDLNDLDASITRHLDSLGVRSMSVGDLVGLSEDGLDWSWHLCAPVGWDDVTSLVPPQPPWPDPLPPSPSFI